MAGTLVSLDDLRASVKRLQRESERFVDQIRRDAGDLVAGRRKPGALIESLGQARKQALEDIDARRARVRALIREQLEAVSDSIRRSVGAANAKDIDHLGRRIADLERKVGELSKNQAAA